MFDTHEATYHLNESWNIIGVECDKFNTRLIWVTSRKTVQWKIWNPWVYAINEELDDIDTILKELTLTYSKRIKRWIRDDSLTWWEKMVA